MAYKVFDDFSADMKTPASATDSPQRISLQNEDQQRVDLPDSSFVRDADISRDGMDLVLETPEGSIIVEGYFAQANPPALVAPDGLTLTPELVRSFAHSAQEYAEAAKGANDASPVGAVQEISGEATVTRTDGTVENVGVGTPIYQGDVIETSEEGAVNIMFVDETTFAVSNDARLAIDEYVFDPATQSGTSNFSVLKGVFVFTSGLIGRDDPDDVEIDTPAGSIGIRGTIIAGDVDTGEITVIEGAIVLNDFSGNTITLSNQYETAKFNTVANSIDHMGDLNANDVVTKFMSVSTVAANLFSSIQDSAKEATPTENKNAQPEQQKSVVPQQEENKANEPAPDQHGASEVQQPAPTPVMAEVITSEDIVTAGQQFMPEIRPVLELQDKPVSLDPVDTRPVILAPLPPPPVPLPENRPPFGVQITRADVQENLAGGGTVAIIKGNFTDSITFHINGVSQNFFDAVRVDATTFRIFLKAGVALDFEKPQRLHFTATNGSGAAIISDSVDLSVLNVNEATILSGVTPNNVGTSNFFSASDGNNWSHNFAQDFADPDGDIAGYSYEIFDNIGTPIANLNAYGVLNSGLNFNTSNGLMTLDFTTTVPDAQFRIIVHALDSSNAVLNSTSALIFETHGRDIISPTGGNYIVPGSQIFSGAGAAAETIVTGGNNSRVYANGGDDTINAAGNNNYYNLGDGNDTHNNTSGSSHYVFGDDGQDTFNLSSVTTSKFYGGNDNDTFNIQTTGVVTTLQAGTGIVIDGGAGFDTLRLNTTGGVNLNFGAINDAFIKNMERISTVNTAANTITLSRDDVLAMTDGNKTLTIQMDANDTLDFVNGSTNQFFNMGQTSDHLYDIFSDGTITLLVSTTGNHAAGTDLP